MNIDLEITNIKIANVFKCMCCADLYCTYNDMGLFCSLKCEALVFRIMTISKTTSEAEEEYFEWMLSKPKGIKITALDLTHPNKKIRERAESEEKQGR